MFDFRLNFRTNPDRLIEGVIHGKNVAPLVGGLTPRSLPKATTTAF
jgi:hypothetical protein